MAGRSKPPPGVDPEAQHLFLQLLIRTAEQDEIGEPVPCRSDPGLWTSDDPADRELAAYACRPCPVRSLCDEFAAAQGEKYGVWGGVDRETTNRRKKAS